MGYPAVGLSGKLTQGQRNSVMQNFAANKYQVLVTTDVASRGLDLLQVSHVVNFDLPKHAEEYVHRIGRTGRAGAKGIAISFVGPKDWAAFCAIESFLRRPLPMHKVESLPAKFKGVDLHAPAKAVKKTKPVVKKAKAKSTNTMQKAKPAAKPNFYQAGDDGMTPVKKKIK